MIVPKVTACPETAVLYAEMTGDRHRLDQELRSMTPTALALYRTQLRYLAGLVDAEIHVRFLTAVTTETTEGT